jgi:hypothetical protein
MSASTDLLPRIRSSNLVRGGRVTVHRRRGGYSLYGPDGAWPIARLRPTGVSDDVEVLYPAARGWRPIGDFGGVAKPLDEALDYIENSGWFRIREPWWSRIPRRLMMRRR